MAKKGNNTLIIVVLIIIAVLYLQGGFKISGELDFTRTIEPFALLPPGEFDNDPGCNFITNIETGTSYNQDGGWISLDAGSGMTGYGFDRAESPGDRVIFRTSNLGYANGGLAFSSSCAVVDLVRYGYETDSDASTGSCPGGSYNNPGSFIMDNLPNNGNFNPNNGDGNVRLYQDDTDSAEVWVCENDFDGNGYQQARYDSGDSERTIVSASSSSSQPTHELPCTTSNPFLCSVIGGIILPFTTLNGDQMCTTTVPDLQNTIIVEEGTNALLFDSTDPDASGALLDCAGPITCSTNQECGIDSVTGVNYCSNGNVVIDFETFTCNLPGTPESSCSSNIAPTLVTDCLGFGCAAGECIPEPACPTIQEVLSCSIATRNDVGLVIDSWIG